VRGVLSTSPASDSSAAIDFQVLEIMKVVKRAIDATALAAADKHLMVRVLHDRKQMRVWGDSVRLAHVFVNLLGNAIKCTPARGAILINFAVSLNAVEVTVTDTGAGMAKDALDSLFNPLAQAKEVQGGGRRRGLAIARDIVRIHGGSLTAWSGGIGSGSSFSVRLPLALASRPPTAA
jgi:signal transduction histidine kinase